MNKTIYIRDEDLSWWDRARELSGDKLSPVLVEAVKRFVAEKEAQTSGYERIAVTYNDALENGLPKSKAFYGRWIIDREKPLCLEYRSSDEVESFSVAETAKGNVVVYKEKYNTHTKRRWGQKLLVYCSFQEGAADDEVNYAIREAVKRRGVPVEELDI